MLTLCFHQRYKTSHYGLYYILRLKYLEVRISKKSHSHLKIELGGKPLLRKRLCMLGCI
jgi:hypothetical protein